MATLKDLSEYTGYSIATISRILNSDPSMSASEETRKKVLEAANTLNYAATKSRKGRNLKTVLSLGIVLSCPHARIEEYYRRLWGSCVGRVCRDMKIEPIDLRFDDNGRLLSGLIGLDGILAIGAFEDAQVEQLFRMSENVVFVDGSPDELHCDAVVSNCNAGIALVMEQFISFGHKRIGYVGSCAMRSRLTRRMLFEILFDLYLDAMRICNMESGKWYLDVAIDAQETETQLLDYVRKGGQLPTALIAATEENAAGIYAAAEALGLSVPEDLSVVAFSSAAQLPRVHPALTAVHVQAEEICRAAVRLICERVPVQTASEVRLTPKKVMIPPALIKRESVSQPKEN